MRRHLIALAAAGGILAPATVGAAEGPGPYVGIAGGVNWLQDSDFDIGGGINVDNEYETGFAVTGAAGYDFGNVWSYGGPRLELEVGYRENDIEDHSVAALGGSQSGSNGDVSTWSLMVNALHDFETGGPITPYIGGGLGIAWVDLDDYGIAAVPNVLDDDDSAFAWQVIAGVGYEVTPRATISLDYRYFSTEADVTTSAATGSASNDVDLDNHTLMIGLRYRF